MNNMITRSCFLFAVLVLLASCEQLEDSYAKNFKPKYPEMPLLPHPADILAGEYDGRAAMRMDESRPLSEYPGVFSVVKTGTDSVMLSAGIKPGAMPFPVNYMLQKPAQLKYSATGYAVNGSFKVDVTLGNGSKKDMPEFYFTLNTRSHFFVDNDGSYWLELYYPDQKMANGSVLVGECFFKGKKKR